MKRELIRRLESYNLKELGEIEEVRSILEKYRSLCNEEEKM